MDVSVVARKIPKRVPDAVSLPLLLSILGAGIGACGGDTTIGPGVRDPAQTYWTLRLDQHAVNMALTAPDDTIRIAATPLTVSGSILGGLGKVTYQANDSTVTVDSTGLVTAHFATPATFVTATLQDRALNVTHADTVFVQVTDTAPQHPLATFSIHPAAGDSAKRAVDFLSTNIFWPVYATDAGGNTVCTATFNPLGIYQPSCALQVYFTSSDPTTATIDRSTGAIKPMQPGRVTFHATTVAYGTTWRDSLPFVIGWPMGGQIIAQWVTPVAGVTPVLSFNPSKIEVGPGADVTWQDAVGGPTPGDSVDVVFDNPANVQPGCGRFIIQVTNCNSFGPLTGGGNIAPFAPDTAARTAGDFTSYLQSLRRGRTFSVVGTYTFHSRRYPTATGEVIVRSDP